MGLARKPVIGVIANYLDREPGREHVRLNAGYLNGVQRAGGLAIILPPSSHLADMRRLIGSVDGLLFGGGHDISPARYGQAPHPAVTALSPRLEPFIFAMFELADAADVPMLGICLGAQAFNVARGGTLHQHLPDSLPAGAAPHHDPQRWELGGRAYHTVTVLPGTVLARAVGEGPVPANSGHHQGIDRLGCGLVASARAGDGVIEAIEDPARRFLLAVQWHPEEMLDKSEHLSLFRSMVAAASEVSNGQA